MVTRLAALALVALLCTGATADDKKDDKTTKVTGTAIIPKDVASFEGRVLELRLYTIEKNVADKKADLIELVEIKDFTHFEGKETKKAFTIGAKGELKPDHRYYVTAFVLKKDARTHIGQADHVDFPLNKVLTDGNPRDVVIRFKDIGKK
ncbi:MAG: hypothetical protein FJ304_14430 [Planctomycetes bacterium]|nr:hypothetical protein [Planctomycetota bacterium]